MYNSPMSDQISEETSGETLSKVDPAYIWVIRIHCVLLAIPFIIGALAGEIGEALMRGTFLLPVLILAILLVFMVPVRRYNARGYNMAEDRLRVVRGLMFRSDTIVPFSRVQHIDVEQGPIERAFGLARLVLHTAGTHNASVTLPGLAQDDAAAMREDIRQHVKREQL